MKDKSLAFPAKCVLFFSVLCALWSHSTGKGNAQVITNSLDEVNFDFTHVANGLADIQFSTLQHLESVDFPEAKYLTDGINYRDQPFSSYRSYAGSLQLERTSQNSSSLAEVNENPGFRISGLEFSGNTVLTSQQICEAGRNVINDYLISIHRSIVDLKAHNKDNAVTTCDFSSDIEITFEVLSNIRAEVDSLYIERGYITSASFIPGQVFGQNEEKKAKISIIEGRLELLDIIFEDENDKTVNYVGLYNYVCDRLKLYLGESREGFNPSTLRELPEDDDEKCQFNNEDEGKYNNPPVVNQNSLTNALELLRLDPLFYQVIAELKPSETNSSSALSITLIPCQGHSRCQRSLEVQPFNGFIGINNSRSPAIGSIERQAQISLFNLFNASSILGPADRFTIGLNNTDGSNTLDLELYIPLSSFGESLTLSYERYSGRLLEAPFNRLDLASESEQFNFLLRRSLGTITSDRESFLDVSGGFYNSTSFILGEAFPISLLEANEEGRTLVLSLSGSLNGLYRAPDNIFAWRTGIEFGSNVTSQQSAFAIFNAQSQYYRKITESTFFLFRSYGQVATGSLPAIKQIGIGGQSSVRGYRPSFLLTDNGLLSTTELQVDIFRSSDRNSSFQVIPFFDVGYGWNNSDLLIPANLAMSTGVGVQIELGQSFFARLDYGIPLVSISSGSQNAQSLFFSLSFTPSPWFN